MIESSIYKVKKYLSRVDTPMSEEVKKKLSKNMAKARMMLNKKD